MRFTHTLIQRIFIQQGKFDAIFDTVGTLDVSKGLKMLNPKGVFLDINPSSKRMVRGFLSRHYKLVFATMGVKYISKKLLIMQIKAF